MLKKYHKLETCPTKSSAFLSGKHNPVHYFTRLPVALQHSLLYASALLIAKSMGFIMVPFTTHYLSLADYGRLDVLQTLGDLMSIVFAMGLTETLYRYASDSTYVCRTSGENISQQQSAANVFGLTMLIAAATLILTQASAQYFSLWLPGNISQIEARLMLASISLGGLVIIPLSWFRIKDRARQFFFASCLMAFFQVSFAVILLVLGYGVSGVLCSTLLALCLLGGYLIKVQLADTGISFNFLLFKRYARYGGPLVFVGIAGFILGSFDRWILAANIGTASMASYALACKIGLLTAVLIQPFDLWWYAKRFAIIKRAKGAKLCARFASIGIVIALFSALIMTIVGPNLIRLLSPIEYHSAVDYIPYLAFLAALHSINSSLSLGIFSGDSTWAVAAVDGLAALLALLGYFIFIPLFEIWGAILATAIALSVRVLISFKISQQCLHIPYPIHALLIQSALTLIAIYSLPVDALTIHNLFLYSAATVLLLFSSIKLQLLPNFFCKTR